MTSEVILDHQWLPVEIFPSKCGLPQGNDDSLDQWYFPYLIAERSKQQGPAETRTPKETLQ
jgi:hypothetical protein